MPALRDFYRPQKFNGNWFDGPVVGIEIEVEGENLPQEAQGFRCERDGSLRGESMEYVFNTPVEWNKGYELCKRLRLRVKQKGSEIYNTGYAGIHVHVNVSDLTPEQLWRFAMAYYVVENILLEWCGEDRRTNLFCLSLPEAPLPIKKLRSALSQADLSLLATDDIRYSALNFKALAEYGSFEFRAMRSTLDENEIGTWVRMLLELRKFALTDYPVRNMVNDLSLKQEAFLEVLLPTTHNVLDDIPFKFERMLDGVREIQYDVFSFDEAKCNNLAEERAKKIAEHNAYLARARELVPPPKVVIRGAPAQIEAAPQWFAHDEANVWDEQPRNPRLQHEPRIDQ